jgi:hypothetical protein
VDPEEENGEDMEFQNTKQELKAVYGHYDSESSDGECHKALHIMFKSSWDIMSRCIIKNLCREVMAASPAPKVVLHCKWMEMPISFDTSNYPKTMAGAGQLPLLISQTISNIKLYHVLIDDGAALNLISFAAFKKLQILMSKLQPSCPFSIVGLVSVMPRGCIPLLDTIGMPENFRTESILFDVMEVNPTVALYQFIVVAHYGYLVLKMSSPNDVLKFYGDRDAGVSALEKLQALATAHEAAAGAGGHDPTPPIMHPCGSALAPCLQPSNNEGVPMKII